MFTTNAATVFDGVNTNENGPPVEAASVADARSTQTSRSTHTTVGRATRHVVCSTLPLSVPLRVGSPCLFFQSAASSFLAREVCRAPPAEAVNYVSPPNEVTRLVIF